jgi:hypothetical protein
MDEERKRRKEGRQLLLQMEEIYSFPQIDSVLLEQLQAYMATREEGDDE